ncbi:MAG: hypothetical protein ACYSUX_13550 [Planctomycetota bacterium]
MNMRRMIVIAAIIWLGWLQVPCGAEKVVLRLKPSEVRQEIDGFGASGAWWAQIIWVGRKQTKGDCEAAVRQRRDRIVDLPL